MQRQIGLVEIEKLKRSEWMFCGVCNGRLRLHKLECRKCGRTWDDKVPPLPPEVDDVQVV